MKYCARTHTGNRRRRNEDSYYIPAEPSARGLFVVADGMGGLLFGNAASQAAVDAVVASVSENGGAPSARALKEAAAAANALVRRIAEKAGADTLMGTTLTLALVEGDQLHVGNAGDSRAYVLGQGGLRCITRDHSYVEELVRSGRITREEARTHPQRNVVTRAIGIKEKVDIDIFELPWVTGDVLLLCSDGLFSEVEDARIQEILSGDAALEARADALIDAALAGGGNDNVTVVLVQNTGRAEA